MRLSGRTLVGGFLCCTLLAFYVTWKRAASAPQLMTQSSGPLQSLPHVVWVVCGLLYLDKLKASIKSALLFNNGDAIFFIFASSEIRSEVAAMLKAIPACRWRRVRYHVLLAEYPDEEKFRDWVWMFRRCASFRLLLPELLSNVDAVLYLDTDTLLMTSVQQLWRDAFGRFNDSHLAAFGEHDVTPKQGFYHLGAADGFVTFPYFKPNGINLLVNI